MSKIKGPSGAEFVQAVRDGEHLRHTLLQPGGYPEYTGTWQQNDVVAFAGYCRTAGFYVVKGLMEENDKRGYNSGGPI